MRKGKIKRAFSLLITAIMLANMLPSVCYGETPDDTFLEQESIDAEYEEESSLIFGEDPEPASEIITGTEDDTGDTSDETVSETVLETDTETETESTETAIEMEFEKYYSLTAGEYKDKERLAEIVNLYFNAVDGIDYQSGIVFNTVDSREKAEVIAELYDAKLVDYSAKVAIYELSEDMSVADALKLASDLSSFYPAVYPNLHGKTVMHEEDLGFVPIEGYEENDGVEELELQSHIVGAMNYLDDWLFENNPKYQWYHEVIGSPYAWANGIKGSGVDIALISTGVTIHDEIDSGCIVDNYNAINDSTSSCNDSYGHGTFAVGELIASINDYYGVGVCPDANIHNIKISDSDMASFTRAFEKAISLNVDIAVVTSMFDLPVPVLEDAIENAYAKGIAVFAPVGATETICDAWPAGYKHAIAVAAVDKSGVLSSLCSNSRNAEFAAPGVFISGHTTSGAETVLSGPSTAVSIVAGEAALILSKKDDIKGLKDSKGVLIPKGPARVDALKKVMQAACIPAGAGTGKGIVYLPKVFAVASATTIPKSPVIGSGEIYRSGSDYYIPITITAQEFDTKFILYTVDGKKPTYNNGTKDKFSTEASGDSVNFNIKLSDINNKEYIIVNAISVTGMDMSSKVATYKIMLNEKAYALSASSVTNKLAPGKTLKMDVAALPNNAKTKQVTWHVSYNNNEEDAKNNGVTISATGVLSAKKNAVTGTYKVWAVSKLASATKSNVCNIEVTDYGIKTIKAPVNRVTKYRNASSIKMTKADLFGMFDVKRADGTNGLIDEVYFTTSNPKVVAVGNDGNYHITGPGNATITAVAADSSGVKGTLTINVIQNAVSIDIPSNGYDKVAVGKSLVLSKPVISPANSNVKSIVWSIDTTGEAAGVKVAGGKVITNKNTIPGTYTVYAKITNKDGSAATGTRTVKVISEQVTKLTSDKTVTVFRECNSFGSNTNATIRTEIEGGEREAGYPVKESFLVTVSNPNLVRISSIWADSANGLSVGVMSLGTGTGKVNLTVAALDGSGKKSTCVINVVNPVSNIKIGPAKAGAFDCVTAGKSLALKATIATENGKTTNTKVNWSLEAGDEIYASISKTGVLTAKATAPNKTVVTVHAEAADGSGAATARSFTIYKNIGKIEIVDQYGNKADNKLTANRFGDGDDFYIKVMSTDTLPFGGFKLSSSNGNVGTVRYTGWNAKNWSQGYCIYKFEAIGISKGTTKITVATRDGSQSVTYTIKVLK
ncbi:MAG: hypothetical protein KBS96_09130 [Lachnospiraceae bacterium]|nr:hypothetical protein [Candidatus Colinaster scatohippi]